MWWNFLEKYTFWGMLYVSFIYQQQPCSGQWPLMMKHDLLTLFFWKVELTWLIRARELKKWRNIVLYNNIISYWLVLSNPTLEALEILHHRCLPWKTQDWGVLMMWTNAFLCVARFSCVSAWGFAVDFWLSTHQGGRGLWIEPWFVRCHALCNSICSFQPAYSQIGGRRSLNLLMCGLKLRWQYVYVWQSNINSGGCWKWWYKLHKDWNFSMIGE